MAFRFFMIFSGFTAAARINDHLEHGRVLMAVMGLFLMVVASFLLARDRA